MARNREIGSKFDREDGREGREIMHDRVPDDRLRLRRAVRRTRILREIGLHARDAVATLVTAPDGFGKTTLLAQRVSEVQSDAERGVARIVDAAGMDAERLYELLGDLEGRLEPRMRPLIAIDNLPTLRETAIRGFVDRIRALHEKGFELMVACRPSNRAFVQHMGDAYKVGPQALLVRPKEFSDWATMLGISGELDVYELTQGVPGLVAMLSVVDGRQVGVEAFSESAASLYRAALQELRGERDALYRTACLLLLTGSGLLRDFERVGMRVRTQTWSRLAREYPIFGVDVEHGTYRCIARHGHAMEALRREVVRARPLFAARAIKVLMAVGNVDAAVGVTEMMERPEDALGVLAEYPSAFALSGNISFVRKMMEVVGDVTSAAMPVGSILAIYLAAMASGELRVARALSAELRRRSREIEGQIDPGSWTEAEALVGLWPGCSGIGLPEVSPSYVKGRETAAARELRMHGRVCGELIGGSGELELDACVQGFDALVGDGVSVPKVLLACDRALIDAMCGDAGDVRSCDEKMREMVRRLLERRLTPIATHVRMVAATCRLLSGLPVTDERAFVDEGTLSVRMSDFPMQLFCLVGEGWQAMETGQCTNALFRARQVLKLAEEGQWVIVSWARMLECCAHVCSTSRMSLDEEANMLDLSGAAEHPVDAWTVALKLAAARRTSELGAWCSLNKDALFIRGFMAFAKQALALLGDKVAAMDRLLPRDYLMGNGLSLVDGGLEPAPQRVGMRDADMLLAQVNVSLFGGFQVERGGHVVTDAAWRRRKACVIAARLVLADGAFVSRRELGDEIWPDKDYLHAREAVYAGLTSLRSAFGQCAEGPQYVLAQGEGVAINTEYVVSDTMRFDALARDILLRRTGTTGRQLVDACLRLDEIYTGPLYVPNVGDTEYYAHQRHVYQTKFVDCMMRGIGAALEMDDLPVASWLVEAALRQSPLREDVIRAAMHIYDMSGRRREVVELYTGHVHVLERELHALPEKETRMAYEEILRKEGREVLLA